MSLQPSKTIWKTTWVRNFPVPLDVVHPFGQWPHEISQPITKLTSFRLSQKVARAIQTENDSQITKMFFLLTVGNQQKPLNFVRKWKSLQYEYSSTICCLHTGLYMLERGAEKWQNWKLKSEVGNFLFKSESAHRNKKMHYKKKQVWDLSNFI